MTKEKRETPEELTRRGALSLLAGASAVFAFGCSSSSGDGTTGAGGASTTSATGSSSATTTAATSTSSGTAECVVSPEGEIGPYFADDSAAGFNRSNVLSNLDGTAVQPGIPLTVTLTVLDTEKGCAPYVGAQVDIWHCNATGVYSDVAAESTTTVQWLRGYQLTDANGKVTFKTIIPGWYSGRTTHIHARIRSSYSNASSTSDGTNTTQLFFDQTFVDRLATSVAPYNAEGKNPTTNAGDHVYSAETNGANVFALTGSDTAGYTGALTLGLPIAAATSTASGGGPGGGGTPPGGH